jgi:uroporphyrinogen III methyltransferase/synthase
LADELIQSNQVAGKKFLLLRADIARPILADKLREAGATVDDIPVYETQTAAALPPALLTALDAGQVTWITFASGGTARNFVKLLGPGYIVRLSGVKIASIGPITTAALRELGLEPTVQAETFNIGGLVKAMKDQM